MADPVVHPPRADDDGDDPRRSAGSGDGHRTGGGHEAAGRGERGDHGTHGEHEAETERPDGSLFDGPALADSPEMHLGRPFSRTAAFYRGFVTTIGVLTALALAMAIRDASSVLVYLLIAAFLAVGLNPIVEFAIRRGVSRSWGVFGVAALIVGVLTAIVVVVGGVLRTQIQTLIDDAPQLITDLRKHKSIAHLDNKYHILSSIQDKLKDPSFLTDYFGGVFNVGLSVLNGVATTVIIFILTLYFLSTLPTLKAALYSLAPASRRERVGLLGDEILRRVGRYVIGAFLVALTAGTVSLLFLFSVGLAEYALPLALAVALLDLVPLVGSILGASIVCIVCLANSLSIGIAAIVFYLIYELLEAYVIYPRVMRSSVDVPEYVTIIAVLLGGTIGGIIGALLALPIGAAVLLLVREVWVRRQDVS